MQDNESDMQPQMYTTEKRRYKFTLHTQNSIKST